MFSLNWQTLADKRALMKTFLFIQCSQFIEDFCRFYHQFNTIFYSKVVWLAWMPFSINFQRLPTMTKFKAWFRFLLLQSKPDQMLTDRNFVLDKLKDVIVLCLIARFRQYASVLETCRFGLRKVQLIGEVFVAMGAKMFIAVWAF